MKTSLDNIFKKEEFSGLAPSKSFDTNFNGSDLDILNWIRTPASNFASWKAHYYIPLIMTKLRTIICQNVYGENIHSCKLEVLGLV